jgi:DNA-binding MarR family transcriptional regulator
MAIAALLGLMISMILVSSSNLTIRSEREMVKTPDEIESLPDHIGWRLWQANRAWLDAFASAMRAAGHDWFTEARAGLLGHIPRAGIRQSLLIERTGTTKQAVQQLLDGLEGEGIIERVADSEDGRGRYIRYTEKGLRALRDGDRIKREIEQDYRQRIGAERFDALMDALRLLQAEH